MFDLHYPQGQLLDVCIRSRKDYGTGSGVGAQVDSFLDNEDESSSNVARQRGVQLGDVLVFIGSQNVFAMDHADVVELLDQLAERLRSKRGDVKENMLTFARAVNFDAIQNVTNQSMPDCTSARNRNHPDVHLPTPASGHFNDLPPPITVHMHTDEDGGTVACGSVVWHKTCVNRCVVFEAPQSP